VIEQAQPRVVLINTEHPEDKITIELKSAPPTNKIMRETGESDPVKIYSDQITELTEKIKEGDLIKSNKFIDNLTTAIESKILNEQDEIEIRDIIATVEERKKGVK
jgi:hypothetical protein